MTNNTNEETGGEIQEVPPKYQAFFNRFKEIGTIPLNDYKPVHLIGYFVWKFKDTYQRDYEFKFNSPSPSKCFEVFQIKKLGQNLSSRPEILIPYIDWIFETKIPQTKGPIRSISFLTKEENTQDYKRVYLNSGKNSPQSTIGRETPIPTHFKKILKAQGLELDTFGDLSFLYQGPKTETLNGAFDELEKAGLNLEVLRKII